MIPHPYIFKGKNYIYWKSLIRAYLRTLGDDVWFVVTNGWNWPFAKTPTFGSIPKLSVKKPEVSWNAEDKK
ncbi:hypothetical protein F1003_16205 [Winogradskyella sp. ZXX205]|uniref:DUF4219 domain-containing protein n=2 Tax=Winogradskyella ouciana TaxID=2608631 RepID=A0A7K1GGN7_9FLAO|nr:hypothetical protein [Winogradskyella ouciana]